MKLGRVLFLFSTGGLWMAACGGSSSGGGAAPVPASDFAGSYAHAVCDNVGPCCAQGGLGYDPNACLSVVQGLVQSEVVDPATATGSKYDANAAGNCIAQVSAIAKACQESTAQKQALNRSCGAVYAGTKQPGDACNTSADCASSPDGTVTCDHWSSGGVDGGVQSGTMCQLRKTPKGGEPCGFTGGMPQPIVGDCDFGASDTFTCDSTSHSCVPRSNIGDKCTSTDACVTTAFCQMGTCAARIALGGACNAFTLVCEATARCDTATQKCVAKLADGAACTSSTDCAGGRCVNGKCASGFAGPPICVAK